MATDTPAKGAHISPTLALHQPHVVEARYWFTLSSGKVAVVLFKATGECWWQLFEGWRIVEIMTPAAEFLMPAWAR